MIEMTDTLLAPSARLNVALFSAGSDSPGEPKMTFEKRAIDGREDEVDVLIVEDLPVFRSGTFRDSIGYQHTWESIHIEQMVAHYTLLKNRGIFADVPIRRDHPGFLRNNMDEVIGYHTGLRSETRKNPVSGKDEVYLLATFEVSDPGAIDKISRRLWRNVSAEVGSFLSNDEAEFWPVYQGVAYVDIPAVEGLKSFNNHNGVGQTFSLMLDNDKETAVPEDNKTTTGQPAGGNFDAAYHGRANFTFSIAGKSSSDFAAVQAHINTIEAQNATFSAAAGEAKEANRKDFIKGLAEGSTPKILASQIPSIEAYALKLDDDSWAHFQKAHEDMPALSTVSQQASATHSGQQVNPSGTSPVGSQPTGNKELDTAVEIFTQHKMSGMKAEKLVKTASFAKIKAAKPDHPIIAGLSA